MYRGAGPWSWIVPACRIVAGRSRTTTRLNPFLLIGVSKTGWNFQYEPLYFYNAYSPQADNIIPLDRHWARVQRRLH